MAPVKSQGRSDMKCAINLPKTPATALVFAVALTGCGGGSSSGEGAGAQQVDERTAALSWNAPLRRQNNEPLKMADLSGYVISYGQDPENLERTVRIDNAGTMEHTIDGLGDGTWYFSVQAEDNNGLVSPPSDLVSKTIQS